MQKPEIGIVEGFFGPEWTWSQRHEFCDLLSQNAGDFYIYAPKRDPYLRKSWMQDHPDDMWKELKKLSSKCQEKKIDFGVGLSPFEIHSHWDTSSKQALKDKIQKLEDLEIQVLGLFFDDMRGSPDLAERQCEIVEFVKSRTNQTLLFCPTYYSDDPILDKVFGQRSENYLQVIGENIDLSVRILWTGSKVISPVITAEELENVAQILKRKPFLWDNYFANDGPKQCKFLSLKPLEGRSHQTLQASSGWAFNLMNQAHLSEIAYLASINVLVKEMPHQAAFDSALQTLMGPKLSEQVLHFQNSLLKVGLDKMSAAEREQIREHMDPENLAAKDILNWLDGHFLVGPECLTD